MLQYKTFAVVGGDLRQAHIANRLAAQGKTVYALLLEHNGSLNPELICKEDPEEVLPRCDVVVFPLPMSADDRHVNAPFSDVKIHLADCLSNIRPGAAVLGGKISQKIQELADNFGLTIVDYLEREELAIKNAVITAEGAVNV